MTFTSPVDEKYASDMPDEQPPLDITNQLPWTSPVEHIAGNEKFALKAFAIQEQYEIPIDGAPMSLVDVTLDLEDGAPVGQEDSLRSRFVALLADPRNRYGQAGIRIHAPDSPHFEQDLKALADECAVRLAYITIPKVRSARDVLWAAGVFEAHARRKAPPLHILIETPEALAAVGSIAALESVRVLDFGLMDFISHLGGAVPALCMRSPGQFDHEIIKRAKADVALAALSYGKTASHNVTVDFRDAESAGRDSRRARQEFGFTRMWSIHPLQVGPIIAGMMPSESEVNEARAIIEAAGKAAWGPIEYGGRLHDRASYRYYWSVLKRGTLPTPHLPRHP